jgi:threonine dehydratase
VTGLVGLAQIRAARERIAGVARLTPVDHPDSLSLLAGRSILLKAEYLQRTGSFKIRGAYNRICQLPAGVDVVAASAGNHAQGVALAATRTGHHATIFMPRGAAIPKVDAARGYGAEVRLEGEAVDDCIMARHPRGGVGPAFRRRRHHRRPGDPRPGAPRAGR